MNKIMILSAVLIITAINAGECIAQHPQWGNLKAGPYAVGFQVINRFDYGRHVQPKLDFEGNRTPGDGALPIQIRMWYPALASGTQKKMVYKEYVYLSKISEENIFSELTPEEKATKLVETRRMGRSTINKELSDETLQAIFNTPTAAVKDAKPDKGVFPLIISEGNPGLNVLYEYLASQGYVVLTVSSGGRYAPLQISKPQIVLDEQIGNLEYLLDFARTISFADYNRVGVLGINFDGMTALLYQMKNMRADAIVSLDGWEGKAGLQSTLMQSPFFEANKLRVPYFVVLQDEKQPPSSLRLSQTVFDTLLYADRYYHVMKEMDHGYLVSYKGIIPGISPEKQTAYQFLYASIGHFFDAYVKKSETGLVFVKKTAVENGFPEGMIKTEHKKIALSPIPTGEELTRLFRNNQYEKIARVLKNGKKSNPHLAVAAVLNNEGYSLLWSKKNTEAISVFILNTELYPDTPDLMDSLAEAYETSGDKENMKKISQQILDLLAKKTTLTNGEKAVKDVAEKRMRQ